MGIYVEVLIRAPIEALWEHTQDPSLHGRWDLRFSTICHLPRGEGEPRRFLYETRIGLGLKVAGEGESTGTRDLPGGRRASALKFASDDPKSIIREGSGYWKSIPGPEGVRFLTWYDYRTRFGRAGALLDRAFFRPMMAWATAWSFDRLRLWLERGVSPGSALRHFATRACARIALALVFAYQGLVPKLLMRDPDELAMLRGIGVPADRLPAALAAFGIAEIAFAIALLVAWGRCWPSAACLVFMAAATAVAAAMFPRYLAAALNPLTLNLCVAALAAIDLLNLADAPSAGRCLRSSRMAEP